MMLPLFVCRKDDQAMEKENTLQRYMPTILWIAVLASIYFVFNSFIAPFADGITLNSKVIAARLKEVGGFLLAILGIGRAHV